MDTEQKHHEELVCFLLIHVIHYVLCDAVQLLLRVDVVTELLNNV